MSQDPFDIASADARAAVAAGKMMDVAAIADRFAKIAQEGEDVEAWIEASELYALVSNFGAAEVALASARGVIGGGDGIEGIDRRADGLRVLVKIGDELTALALAAGRINARHTSATPRERATLEARMSAIELKLEAAGLDLDKLEGGFDEILETFWGPYHASLFRLALALESLIGDLFPAVDRNDILGTVRENLDIAMPLARMLAGREITEDLRNADLERVKSAGEKLLAAAEAKAKLD